MTQIQLSGLTAFTPTDVYVADLNGNNKTYLGQITGSIPPTNYQTVPSSFDGIEGVMLILSANNGCEKFKIIPCS